MARKVFSENVVVITGGSSGIGREMAYQLCAHGARLVLAAREPLLLEAVAAECIRRGAQAIAVPTDVSVESQCSALIARAVEEYGRIDTLVNNAGISMRARFDELGSVEPVERLMNINYLGSVYCTWHALPHLKRSHGRIVETSSLAGLTGVPTLSAYSASKHAVTGFFESLRPEVAADGVSITLVYPGFVATDIAVRAIGPRGTTLGVRRVVKARAMPVEECAAKIISAAADRRRDVVMTVRGKVGRWLKLIAPAAIDRITMRAVERGW
jgi:NAD(P)-dependent dehydrogenase (short-subunit alcohol dehydrogenase family)